MESTTAQTYAASSATGSAASSAHVVSAPALASDAVLVEIAALKEAYAVKYRTARELNGALPPGHPRRRAGALYLHH